MKNEKEQKIPFDGFGSVIELLTYSDKQTREKILRNIAARDPGLAERLLHATNDAITELNYRKQNQVKRSQRRQNMRSYGTNK